MVFGKLESGFEILKRIEAAGTQTGDTTADVVIEDCGVERADGMGDASELRR